jgi:hypothetical protein
VYEVDGNKTDPFNKMVDDVRSKKYDIAVAALRCVSERAQIVNYMYLMHRSKYVPAVICISLRLVHGRPQNLFSKYYPQPDPSISHYCN